MSDANKTSSGKPPADPVDKNFLTGALPDQSQTYYAACSAKLKACLAQGTPIAVAITVAQAAGYSAVGLHLNPVSQNLNGAPPDRDQIYYAQYKKTYSQDIKYGESVAVAEKDADTWASIEDLEHGGVGG